MTDDVRAIIESAKRASELLPASSLIRPRLTAEFWRDVEERMGAAKTGPIGSLYFPPIVLFLAESPVERILSLENDLAAVHAATPAATRADLTSFLTSRDDHRGPCTERAWAAGRFELSIKSRLLRAGSADEFDPVLEPTAKTAGSKRADVRVRVGARTAYIECTALTDSDLDRQRWDGEMEAWRQEGGIGFVGQVQVSDFDGLQRRVYAKIYDKLAKGGDPAATQLPAGCVNVLALSIDTHTSVFGAQHPVVGWALDQVLTLHVCRNSDEGLAGYLLHLSGGNANLQALLEAPRRLSAVLVFDRCRLVHSRVNYNAAPVSRITHAEVTGLEQGLVPLPEWCP